MAQSIVSAFKNAAAGILHAAHQRNFKIELGFGVAAIVLGLAFKVNWPEWAAIIICIGMVLGGECLNTAMEAAVDLASPEYHELAKHAKDCAAGAVLVASIASVGVAAVIFIPRFINLLM